MNFKAFWEIQGVLREFNEQPIVRNPFQKNKTWSAKKKEIIQTWQNLRTDVPIVITPIDNISTIDKQSYGEDGLRITGSWPFISSVLGRLKELVSYENPQTKLRLVLRSVEPKEDGSPMVNRPAYVFYLNVERRGAGTKV